MTDDVLIFDYRLLMILHQRNVNLEFVYLIFFLNKFKWIIQVECELEFKTRLMYF